MDKAAEIAEQEARYAKLSQLSAGDTVTADGFHRCLEAGRRYVVHEEDGVLYVECADGHHCLDGSTLGSTDEDTCWGFFPGSIQ